MDVHDKLLDYEARTIQQWAGMWHYCWAHAVYHVTRWFPRNNRLKIRIVSMILTVGALVPQIWVLAQPHSSRYCGQHLFEFLIISIILTFCMIGFSFLFSLMDPTPWEVKLAFHIFGIVTMVMGIVLTAFTSVANDCKNNTEELYYFSVAASFYSMSTIVFFLVMIPFWVANRVRRNLVLDIRNRLGICYEPYACCSCVWHI